MKYKPSKAFKVAICGTIMAIMMICCFVLAGCDPGSYYFTQEYLSDIVSVELIDYSNSKQRHFISWVPDHSSELKAFDNSKYSVIETLDDDKIDDFIDTLCECHILSTYYAYNSPKGLCLKLNYSNGDFVIANCQNKSFAGYVGKFTASGKVAKFIGCFSSYYSFKTLVNDYFQTQI